MTCENTCKVYRQMTRKLSRSEKIITIIESVYLVQETNLQLRQRFYERLQKETETSETYSLAVI